MFPSVSWVDINEKNSSFQFEENPEMQEEEKAKV